MGIYNRVLEVGHNRFEIWYNIVSFLNTCNANLGENVLVIVFISQTEVVHNVSYVSHWIVMITTRYILTSK